jgi:hypothetical protein
VSERCVRCFALETERVTIVVGDEELELKLCASHLGELLTGATPLASPGTRASSPPSTLRPWLRGVDVS